MNIIPTGNLKMTIWLQALRRFDFLCSLSLSRWIIEEDIITLISQRPTLTHLYLEHTRLIIRTPITLNLGNLKHLNLAKSYGNLDNLVGNLAQSCHNLTYLNISECPDLSTQGLNTLALLENLEDFQAQNTAVDDTVLRGFKNLVTINVQECQNVRNEGILRIFKDCRRLSNINIYNS